MSSDTGRWSDDRPYRTERDEGTETICCSECDNEDEIDYFRVVEEDFKGNLLWEDDEIQALYPDGWEELEDGVWLCLPCKQAPILQKIREEREERGPAEPKEPTYIDSVKWGNGI